VLEGVHFGWYKMIARPDAEAPGVGELTETLGVPYLFEFRGRSPYTGGLRFDADAPPFMLPIDEALLTFSGGTLSGSFTGIRLEGDAQAGALELASPTGTFAVRGLHASVDNELRSEYVMPGRAAFSIDAIAVAYPQQSAEPLFEAENLGMRSDVALDAAGELLEMNLDYDVAAVRLEQHEVTGGTLTVRVRDLDVATVEAYSAAATDAAAAGADPAAIAAALGPHLERALKRGPSVTLDPIRFRYGDEPFQARIEITTNPARLPAAGTLRIDNALQLLGLVNLEADVQLSKVLAAELATLAALMQLGGDPAVPPEQLDYLAEAQSGLMLTLLVGQGVLIEDGDGYRSTLDYTDGALTLNGNPLPFGLP
jgi:uncharacterized protein YdgA (DUF945 family)